MLTIDYLDEANMPAEKPSQRVQAVVYRQAPGAFDRLYDWAQERQQDLRRAAHNARLLKLAKDSALANDAQHSLETVQRVRMDLVGCQDTLLR